MIADVRQRLHNRPFKPFWIVTSSGQRYLVPTTDHAGISAHGHRVVVWSEDDSGALLSGLHITAIEEETTPKKNVS